MDSLNLALENASLIRDAVSYTPLPNGTSSETQFLILKDYIAEFEKNLDSEHEVGMLLTNFGSSIVLHVTHITYEEPVLMVFKGYANGQFSTLIQHVNQLNFLLTSVEKAPDRPKYKIGFSPE